MSEQNKVIETPGGKDIERAFRAVLEEAPGIDHGTLMARVKAKLCEEFAANLVHVVRGLIARKLDTMVERQQVVRTDDERGFTYALA